MGKNILFLDLKHPVWSCDLTPGFWPRTSSQAKSGGRVQTQTRQTSSHLLAGSPGRHIKAPSGPKKQYLLSTVMIMLTCMFILVQSWTCTHMLRVHCSVHNCIFAPFQCVCLKLDGYPVFCCSQQFRRTGDVDRV